MANEKNLKPFKAGHPGGPGRPKNPPELQFINRMTKAEFQLLTHRLLDLRPDELDDFKGTVLEMAMASIIKHAIKHGDHQRLQFFVERLFGKITDKVEISATAHMSPREKLAAAKAAILKLESQLEDE